MDRSTFNFLQKVSYDYIDTLRRIKEIEQEIIYGVEERDNVEVGKSSVRTVSDTTSKKATALIDDERLIMLKKQTQAVEYALKNIIGIKREFIERMYWKESRKSITELIDGKGISERTAYRWRREYLAIVGKKMGLVE